MHPDLRCVPEQGTGYTLGNGGCALPADLDALAERELREHYQESLRRGWIVIEAA